ncbi:MAG TPA: hypothetical protein VFD35_07815 [Pricia sp.]|nr:hypothetical protein [Pricia sp.]
MITCEQAAFICNKAQYREASDAEKIKLRSHLATCNSCAAYTDRNIKFTTLCQKANLRNLSEEDKNRMKALLKSQS